MKENKSIRIRTQVNGPDKHIKIHLDQSFNLLEILSLKLRQEDVYRSMCSDYGMLCGRVSTKDFGIPNAKISIFIPLAEDDENNQLITSLYPYKKTSDKDERGIRYNLLPKEKRNTVHQPVGTFSSKREILDNDLVLEIYEKYYKFSTTTNSSGDYMIMGIPVGTHTVHMDIDFSDIGFVSSRPYELIEKGYDENLFENRNKFKRSTNLDELAQIVTQNRSVEILPFWGNLEQCEVGITRTDFDIQNFEITPSAIFFGSMYADHVNHFIDVTGIVVRGDGWGPKDNSCYLHPDPGVGTIEIITKTENGDIESLEPQKLGPSTFYDTWGDWGFSILMNKSRKITDEFGNQVVSSDISKGVPTEIDVRFKISFDSGPTNTDLKFAKYLVPNMKNRFDFGDNTHDEDFYTMKWKRIYTVRQYIPRFQTNSVNKTVNHTGIQRVDECPWSLKFPYNRATLNLVGRSWGGELKSLSTYGTDSDDDIFNMNKASTSFPSFSHEKSFEFYNNWINGSLYSFIFGHVNNNFHHFDEHHHSVRYIVDKSGFTKNFNGSNNVRNFEHGLIKKEGNEFFYISHDHGDPSTFLHATNITDLGSSIDNSGEFGIPNAPFIFDKLVYTSWKLPNNANDVFFEKERDFNIPNNFGGPTTFEYYKIKNQDLISKTCEIGREVTIDPNTLVITETFDNDLRKSLCELNGDIYSSNSCDSIETFYDQTNNNKFSFYFYFGLTGGISNSLSLVKKKFFS